ncbi:uncharacterized protein LOC129587638 [Paramacrobiotus metropolitanus]|uniref:uncharacterized protein LOC129587638 n=1 Tax=Paramacrobiotus metropolitanus TaxID=2943436 RepID=UPI0024462B1D|nr:uncharacterized protein LOC129587638 [Paramacrobiotus metropolitanus]
MSRQILLIAIAVLSCIAVVTAIRCYECNGSGCINPTADLQKDCGTSENVCYRTVGTAAGATVAARGCGKVPSPGGDGLGVNECKDTPIQGITTSVCNCNTRDFCNAAGHNQISLFTAGISVIFAIVLAKMI